MEIEWMDYSFFAWKWLISFHFDDRRNSLREIMDKRINRENIFLVDYGEESSVITSSNISYRFYWEIKPEAWHSSIAS